MLFAPIISSKLYHEYYLRDWVNDIWFTVNCDETKVQTKLPQSPQNMYIL